MGQQFFKILPLPYAMTKKSAKDDLPASYGEAVDQLEALIASLESGQLPLEDLLGQYQRGAALLKYCRERLQAVEEQVKLLDDDGTARPWPEASA
jgi:exodeoxyribonuclease VII small subunit